MARDTCDERVKRKMAASRPVCVWNTGCFSMRGDFAPKRHSSLSGEIFGPENWESKHIIHREAPPVENHPAPTSAVPSGEIWGVEIDTFRVMAPGKVSKSPGMWG